MFLSNNFKQCFADHFLFIRQSHNTFTTLIIRVYDLVIVSNNLDIINQVKTTLQHHFNIKDLGTLK